jgi:hypothetical protein
MCCIILPLLVKDLKPKPCPAPALCRQQGRYRQAAGCRGPCIHTARGGQNALHLYVTVAAVRHLPVLHGCKDAGGVAHLTPVPVAVQQAV